MTTILTWAWWRKRNRDNAPPGDPAPGKSPAAFPLQLGSKGSQVKTLQKWMNTNYATNLAADGILGPLTLAAWQTIFPLFSQPWGSTLASISETFYKMYVLNG